MIYYPIGCHNYNTIQSGQQEIKIATMDTMLSFYLAFIYAKEYSGFRDRIMCMAQFLFDIEKRNRLEQKGILKRFSLTCIGKQPTLENIRAMKADKFKELANNRNSEEYQMWFLRYNPRDIKGSKTEVVKSSSTKTQKRRGEKEKGKEKEKEKRKPSKTKRNKPRGQPKPYRIGEGFLY
jgi:hypothetical protein